MTPREFLRGFRRSRPAPSPPASRLAVAPGATVGVVMMTTGGPATPADVEAFLFNRLMDPAETDSRLPARLRRLVCRAFARRHARGLARAYELIGGTSPLARYTREQAQVLERVLNRRFGAATGATFRTYVAMRHWHPTTVEAAEAMAADGVTDVVLLPLHPHASHATTGSSLAYWDALAARGEVSAWPTARVAEYAAHPKYVQALAERIDEGLQRFPREMRHRVQVLFCAQGGLHDLAARTRDPYPCLVQATVKAVVAARDDHDAGRGVHVAYGRPLVRGRALAPEVRHAIAGIAEAGFDAVLVVPVSFVTDRIETAYELDVVVRAQAAEAGVVHFEVSHGLNSHPLFIDALADCVATRIAVPTAGDGASVLLVAAEAAAPTADAVNSAPCCDACSHHVEAAVWPQATVDDTAPVFRDAA
jgi:ferrochelatase